MLPVGSTAWRRRIRRREAVPPIGGTVGCRAIARHGVEGGTWRHPQRDAAGDANGHPYRDRRPIGRRHFSAAGSGGIPAPPTGGASTGGRFLGTPMGVLCEPPGTVPSIDGTVCGAGYCRHGMVPPGTVPPIGGTVSPGDGKARDGRARRGLAGTLGRPSVSCSRSTALFPACRPENADFAVFTA